ncbi:hypothetical protein E1B28_011715 [Marasmius oreades]|uniref:Uncharacterized protein n=1 Tax=Marasmius oreades TaxID=181124 RepID=A0A9P7RW33_9AGAR|nr:uncharacterized protein E1B28_011715 [Marasmius oreades]KAG7090103.1 hypothetical protein E1B28_011715 [Marasmius oreades]
MREEEESDFLDWFDRFSYYYKVWSVSAKQTQYKLVLLQLVTPGMRSREICREKSIWYLETSGTSVQVPDFDSLSDLLNADRSALAEFVANLRDTLSFTNFPLYGQPAVNWLGPGSQSSLLDNEISPSSREQSKYAWLKFMLEARDYELEFG